MTSKRDKKKDEPKAAKRPRLKKETVKDLAPDGQAEGVRGGGRPLPGAGSANGCSL